MNEAQVRDLIANDLSVLEDGLELLNIEQYVPSEMGTRGFIDILARDSEGHWVIIEVKRTKTAPREAAHEVFKYVEGIQRHFGVRNNEIRAIVASVEWKELLIPFSRLQSETNIDVIGMKLDLDEASNTLTASKVTPIPVNRGRYIAPWHELRQYHNRVSLDKGISTYQLSCKAKGVKDYVILVLKASDWYNEAARAGMAQSLNSLLSMVGFDDGEAGKREIPVLPDIEYSLYFAPQMLTRDFCINELSKHPEEWEEIEAYIGEMDSEGELCTLHESLFDLKPWPHSDHLEIAYPAKLKELLNVQGWTIERVLRFGVFSRNVHLSDEDIIDELKGATGSSKSSFKRTIDLSSRSHIASAKEGIASALSSNPSWLAQVSRAIDEASIALPNGKADINIFSPSAGVFTLFNLATTRDFESYAPIYTIDVYLNDDELITQYVGILAPFGTPVSFSDVLAIHYGGGMPALMMLASSGFYEARDADVMDSMGLAYRSYRVDNPYGDSVWEVIENDRWRRVQSPSSYYPVAQFIDDNPDLIGDIVAAIKPRMHNGFHDMS